MTNTFPRVGRSLAPALLFVALAGQTLAAPGVAFKTIGQVTKTLTPAALVAARKTETISQVSADKKTLTFAGNVVRMVATTGPEDDMLSYRIAGLRNPTLVVPRGATIRLLFVNTDDDMRHDIRFGTAPKTYPNVMTASLKSTAGTPELPHKSETALRGEELTLRVPVAAGAYAYFCTVRGHAQGGMVGKMMVR